MNEKTNNFILQALILICITILACLDKIDSQSIMLLLGTIVGYAFAVAKEAYIKKDNDK